MLYNLHIDPFNNGKLPKKALTIKFHKFLKRQFNAKSTERMRENESSEDKKARVFDKAISVS